MHSAFREFFHRDQKFVGIQLLPISSANMIRLVSLTAATWCYATFTFKSQPNPNASETYIQPSERANAIKLTSFEPPLRLYQPRMFAVNMFVNRSLTRFPYFISSVNREYNFPSTSWMNLRCFWFAWYSKCVGPKCVTQAKKLAIASLSLGSLW